jgi:hypothetical protein
VARDATSERVGRRAASHGLMQRASVVAMFAAARRSSNEMVVRRLVRTA